VKDKSRNRKNIDLKAIAVQAMMRYGFEAQFSRQVTDEVESMVAGGLKYEPGGVRDLRHLLWSSIDNLDTLDFDQLEYCERGGSQEIMVKVAIADVDSLVKKSSKTDEHAARNGSSVYAGVSIFPMLPEKLSSDLTSLRPGVDRLAVVIEYAVLADGSFRPGDVYRALVKNKAKLVYEETGDWLEGKSGVPEPVAAVPGLQEQLRLQDEASQRLKGFRLQLGALEFDTIEAKPVIREDAVKDLVVVAKNRAHYLIENVMVAANETIVAFLEKAGIPIIQRVVRVPRNWDGIRAVASTYNETLPVEPVAKALADFLIRRKDADPLRFPDLSLTVVKLLGPGEYMMLEPGKPHTGHFCLAVMDYTHSTAPNRRYVDVIIQRLIKSVLDKKQTPYTMKELTDYSAWCTDREKAGKKVERFMRKAAAAAMLHDRLGESFDAIVTGASDKGTYVRLLSPPAEGRVIRGMEGMTVGQRVRVRLAALDPYRGFIDFVGGG